MIIRNNIDALVRALDIPRKECAAKIGISEKQFYQIANGKAEPSGLTMLKIARYFKRSTDDIFYLEEETSGAGHEAA